MTIRLTAKAAAAKKKTAAKTAAKTATRRTERTVRLDPRVVLAVLNAELARAQELYDGGVLARVEAGHEPLRVAVDSWLPIVMHRLTTLFGADNAVTREFVSKVLTPLRNNPEGKCKPTLIVAVSILAECVRSYHAESAALDALRPKK